MTTASVVDMLGAENGILELSDAVFGITPNRAVMHQALIRQLANARQGTHDTKTRGEVRGGGRKPWRQKGTGRARQGSIRAPHWAHGGTVFGPTPRSHDKDMPRKQRRLALRSALAVKAQDNQLTVLDKIELDAPKTRQIAGLLTAVTSGKRVLLVIGQHHENLEKSSRNIAYLRTVMASNLSVRDLLTADCVLMTRDALEHVSEVWA